FSPEFEARALRKMKRLCDHQIRILQPRPANRVPRAVSNYKLWRSREGRGVEILGDTTAIKLVGVTDSVGPLNCKTQARVVVGSLGHWNRVARLHPHQARNLPT